ncbi:sigma-54-dependent transcriptional regulator [Desulfosporosinus metallidurans]|uniref:Stage 0 sporulation protein A homolog n=1 Tax=Desulfosporosinus metallidurans TaxID=1888891 RepID=A0A1Q8QHD7_9FIRM|nr:sigma-54 dependent transcriptional regulator [Desulfosporosinus metallidurans]OLN26760.1 Sigma-54-dependent transcriptional regulator [Desulfosporosinus metallidurans]
MKYHQRILILDDEEALRSIIAQRLKRKGYEVLEAGTAREGLQFLHDTLLDGVLLDLRLPDGDGLEVLHRLKDVQPDLQVVMLTGHGTLESAIEAMKAGAFDYLTKPCNLSELELTLLKALEQRKLLVENTGLRQVVSRQTPELKIIGESPKLLALLELTRKIALSDAPVLIQGESGVGKELIARAVHLWSPREHQAYVPVNAGAIPESLMESELFGHEKGAFTGAGGQKIGLVEIADHGTLFLDEIGEMPLALQVKLLRFLEAGEFRRVGDSRLRRVDVRIVTATNRSLAEEVEQGRFRKDLYYRLNGLTLHVPPLRERKEDILPLAEYFLYCKTKMHTSEAACVLAPETRSLLIHYDYPGNVRELIHLMERGMILAGEGIIQPWDIWPENAFAPDLHPRPAGEKPSQYSCQNPESSALSPASEHYPTLEQVERQHILSTLQRVNGNRARAAKLLDISVRNLYRKVEGYSLAEK